MSSLVFRLDQVCREILPYPHAPLSSSRGISDVQSAIVQYSVLEMTSHAASFSGANNRGIEVGYNSGTIVYQPSKFSIKR